MSKPERGSLTTLLTKKPLGQGAPAAVPLEQAESSVLGREDGGVHEAVQPDVRTHVFTQERTDPQKDSGMPAPPKSSTAVHTDANTAAQTDVQADVQPTRLLNRSRRRTVRVPWTFKMPFDLREELESVARFNDLNMTEIAVEAIERHLRHFPHPPGKEPRAGETG